MKSLLTIALSFLLFSCNSDRPNPCECLELASSLMTKVTTGEITEEEANAEASICSYMDGFSENELAEKLEGCSFKNLDEASNKAVKDGLEESLSKDACACMDRIADIQSTLISLDTTDEMALNSKITEMEQIKVDCAWMDEMRKEDLQIFFKACPEYLSELD